MREEKGRVAPIVKIAEKIKAIGNKMKIKTPLHSSLVS